MAESDKIIIRGARAHNLKNIDVDIPRHSFVVITGPSGSGKSSLAFDTIYAEGQRRYMNTLSPYARHFMGILEKPQVESIDGLSPIIAIEQKTTGNNPRSTVGTITEISDFLRLLYAKASTAYSPVTGKPLVRYTDEQIVDLILSEYHGRKCLLLAPLVRGRKGHYRELFESLRKKGYTQVRVDSELMDLGSLEAVDRYKGHFIELVVDKLKPGEGDLARVRASVANALGAGKGSVAVMDMETGVLRHFSKHLVDPESGLSLQEPAPHTFSFNSPEGYCPHCKGLGTIVDVNMDTIIPDRNVSIYDGGIVPLGRVRDSRKFDVVRSIARKMGFSLHDPIAALPDEAVSLLVYGSDEFFRVGEGNLSEMVNWPGVVDDIEDKIVCPVCHGTRLKAETECFKIDGKTISEVSSMEISALSEWLKTLPGKFNNRSNAIARDILKELSDRVQFLLDVGLDYLSLDRPTASLSGGESQRIRLATQIGSRLVNVVYILDEPSIGLHQRDNRKLIASLKALRDEGNTVIVVEHDLETMLSADYLVDVGPGAGSLGGEICYAGPSYDGHQSNGASAAFGGCCGVLRREPSAELRSQSSLRPLPPYPASSLRDNLSPEDPSPCPCPGVDRPVEGNSPAAPLQLPQAKKRHSQDAARSADTFRPVDTVFCSNYPRVWTVRTKFDKDNIDCSTELGSLMDSGRFGGVRPAIRKIWDPAQLGSLRGTPLNKLDMGPGEAGSSECRSLTLEYLTGEKRIEVPKVRRSGNGKVLRLKGARGNNLKGVDVEFPLGTVIGVSGVSGSGKSSLINETLMPILKGHFYHFKEKPLPYDSIEGIDNIDKVIEVDQSPIGRSPRSNPATFTGVFDDIRKLFEDTQDAKIRGFKAGRFSFNVSGGRCEACKGAGIKVVEMNFLPSVNVVCEECRGRRYKEDTLAVRYKGKNINDVLEMSISEAYEFFKALPKIAPKLKAMVDVGLGYVHLGQSAVTLSGGESQRMKLAAELGKNATGNTLYMLDEPTTGLHSEDIKVLLDVLQKLVDQGNTVIVIEHNLDVLKSVDWLLDMGPEGGRRGGRLIAAGTPEQVAANPDSVTGIYLKEILEQ